MKILYISIFLCFSFSFLKAKVLVLSNWEIHFGDLSPEKFNEAEWKISRKTFFENNSKGGMVIFFKTTLPEINISNLAINTFHFDQYVELYLETNKIYEYGSKHINLSSFGKHLIDLPANATGKTLYIKVFSDFQNIGFSYPILYGEKSELILNIIRSDIDKNIFAVLTILLGISVIFIGFSTESQIKYFISIGIFSILLGVTTFCRNQIKSFIFGNNFFFWGYLELITLYLLPSSICYFVYLFNKSEESNIFTKIALSVSILNLSFGLITPILSIFDHNILLKSLPLFNYILLVTLIVGIINIFYLVFLRKSKEALMIFYGILAIILFAIFDLMQNMKILPRVGFTTHWGIFVFIFFLLNLLKKRLYKIHNNLKIYVRQLELDKIYIKKSHEELSFLTKELEVTQREVILRLCEIAEARSKETGNHILRVSQFSKILADLLGLSEKDVRLITLASPMHDIGKLGIPDEILNKPSKLTPEEFELIKKHTIIGYEMLNKSKKDLFISAAIIALQHHEKYDGSGYPNGLKGNEIHIYGKIVALADVFDSLSSDRVYKKAWPIDKVMEFVMEESGKQFDPELVNLLVKNSETFLRVKRRYEDESPLILEEDLAGF